MGADELDQLLEVIEEGAEEAPPSAKGKDEFKKFLKAWGKAINQGYQPAGFDQLVVTEIPALDIGMEIGGIPAGCLVSSYGPEGAGKSALWQFVVGRVQRQLPGRIIVIIDAEARFNAVMAAKNGMNLSKELFDSYKLMYLNPSLNNGLSYEKVIVMLEQLIKAAPEGVFMVIDSLDALATQSELEMDADDGGAKYGGMAKSNSVTLKRLCGLLKQTNSTLWVVQQLRDKIGGMGYGPQTDTSGGHAIKHYSSIRFRLTPIKTLSDSKTGEILGRTILGKFDKNLYGTPGVEFKYDLLYGQQGGVDVAGNLIDIAVEVGLASKTDQGMYTFPTIMNDDGQIIKFRGRANGRAALAEKPEMQQELYRQIRLKLSSQEVVNE